MTVNAAGLRLIKRWEGLELEAYMDTGGVWTIGYGHTSDALLKVTPGLVITEEKAEELLIHDLKEAEAAVNRLVKVPLNENQYAALVSFAYNLGEGNLAQSTLLKKLNRGQYGLVPSELSRWVYDDGVKLRGLINRRKAEADLWITPTQPSAKPKPILKMILKVIKALIKKE